MPHNQQSITMQIGERLREARQRQRLSLRELSMKTGCELSKSRISNYEQGLRRLGLEEAQILSEALGDVSTAYLLCMDDASPWTPQERDLIRFYRACDARGQDLITMIASTEAERAPTAESLEARAAPG